MNAIKSDNQLNAEQQVSLLNVSNRPYNAVYTPTSYSIPAKHMCHVSAFFLVSFMFI